MNVTIDLDFGDVESRSVESKQYREMVRRDRRHEVTEDILT